MLLFISIPSQESDMFLVDGSLDYEDDCSKGCFDEGQICTFSAKNPSSIFKNFQGYINLVFLRTAILSIIDLLRPWSQKNLTIFISHSNESSSSPYVRSAKFFIFKHPSTW
jgi:hypothetical protein